MKKDPYAPIRDQVANPPEHWRSLEHKEHAPEYVQRYDSEFPNGAAPDQINRRDLLKLSAAASLLGSAACVRRPEEEILPYTVQPEQVVPGVRLMYATAIPRSEGALGVIVESHTGRPTKIEGNPRHPSSLGATDMWAQGEVLKLYDPDRARAPRQGGKDADWAAFDTFANEHFGKLRGTGGEGLAFLLEDELGPTFERLLGVARSAYPRAQFFRYDPLAPDMSAQGAELAFGAGSRVHYDLTKAKVIFSLDSNFLMEGPDHLRLAREFAKKRELVRAEEAAGMNRLYVAEGTYTVTGANSDHRLRVASGEAVNLLRALASQLGVSGAGEGKAPEGSEKFVAALAKDLKAANGAVAIFVGERQPAEVHALGYAVMTALGAGTAGTLLTSSGGGARVSHAQSIKALADALNANQLNTLVVFGANPVYTAPGALKFADAMAKAQTVIHAGVMPDETAEKATWHVPTTHFLEAWGDATAWDGTVSIVQPLIYPIFGARPATTLLAQLANHPEKNDKKLVEETHAALAKDRRAWQQTLTDGVIANSARSLTPATGGSAAAAATVKAVTPSQDSLELVTMRGNVLDGRMANVSWLIEAGDPMTKLSWDNAILMSPALAKDLGIESGVSANKYNADLVDLVADKRTLRAPVFVYPGLAKHTLAIAAGYGRKVGSVAAGVGVDANPFLPDTTGVVQGIKLTRVGDSVELCSTQDHFSVPADPMKRLTFAEMAAAEGKDRNLGLAPRPLLRQGDADAFVKDPQGFARQGDLPANLVQLKTPNDTPSLGKPVKPIQPHSEILYEGQQWGMTIDLSTCIGCNACAIACYAENNIPSVGRDQVLLGRELAWIRVDRYFAGDIDAPVAAHQPVPCMHCENAPCEPVCPVAATVHDEEGLNTMAYNRCIGTRYCNNNCPYKVRRFNYLDYSATGNFYVNPEDEARWKTLKMQRNPDVTVRYRGVMEKCTYCAQRIDEAKIAAKRAGLDRRQLPDGAVITACAQACPTQAISFGNINDPNSRVAKLKASPRNYEMLQDLNVRPRTTYLARVRNENEELA